MSLSLKKQRTKLWVVLILGLASSVLGLVYSFVVGDATHGGRGGAIAVLLSFLALFTSTPSVQELIEARDEDNNPGFDALDDSRKLLRLRTAISTMIDVQREQNIFLMITSGIGTIVWGFGDIFVRFLGVPN